MIIRLLVIIVLTIVFTPVDSTQGWGFTAHMRINSDAVDTLPAGMKKFFESERNFISEHAVDPDRWKRDDKSELPRHFIDLDMYGTYPFKELPRDYDEAVKKFGAETVNSRGTLPWRIAEYTLKLAEDMKSGKREKIRMTAAALGHYVGDSYSPLHSVENYNGQYTNNYGVHKQFENRMVNAYMDSYEPQLNEAASIKEPLRHAFDIVMRSYKLVLPILESETKARKILTSGQIDSLNDWRAKGIPDYLAILYSDLGEMGWNQMNSASYDLGRYWVSAWELAGKPVLPE